MPMQTLAIVTKSNGSTPLVTAVLVIPSAQTVDFFIVVALIIKFLNSRHPRLKMSTSERQYCNISSRKLKVLPSFVACHSASFFRCHDDMNSYP